MESKEVQRMEKGGNLAGGIKREDKRAREKMGSKLVFAAQFRIQGNAAARKFE